MFVRFFYWFVNFFLYFFVYKIKIMYWICNFAEEFFFREVYSILQRKLKKILVKSSSFFKGGYLNCGFEFGIVLGSM